MNNVSSVIFEDKKDVSENYAYSTYDNNPSYVTPNNINELKGSINQNAKCLSSLNKETIKTVTVRFLKPQDTGSDSQFKRIKSITAGSKSVEGDVTFKLVDGITDITVDGQVIKFPKTTSSESSKNLQIKDINGNQTTSSVIIFKSDNTINNVTVDSTNNIVKFPLSQSTTKITQVKDINNNLTNSSIIQFCLDDTISQITVDSTNNIVKFPKFLSTGTSTAGVSSISVNNYKVTGDLTFISDSTINEITIAGNTIKFPSYIRNSKFTGIKVNDAIYSPDSNGYIDLTALFSSGRTTYTLSFTLGNATDYGLVDKPLFITTVPYNSLLKKITNLYLNNPYQPKILVIDKNNKISTAVQPDYIIAKINELNISITAQDKVGIYYEYAASYITSEIKSYIPQGTFEKF